MLSESLCIYTHTYVYNIKYQVYLVWLASGNGSCGRWRGRMCTTIIIKNLIMPNSVTFT